MAIEGKKPKYQIQSNMRWLPFRRNPASPRRPTHSHRRLTKLTRPSKIPCPGLQCLMQTPHRTWNLFKGQDLKPA